jgi:hypothetical protein
MSRLEVDMDLLMVALVLAFFASAVALMSFCKHLLGGGA